MPAAWVRASARAADGGCPGSRLRVRWSCSERRASVVLAEAPAGVGRREDARERGVAAGAGPSSPPPPPRGHRRPRTTATGRAAPCRAGEGRPATRRPHLGRPPARARSASTSAPAGSPLVRARPRRSGPRSRRPPRGRRRRPRDAAARPGRRPQPARRPAPRVPAAPLGPAELRGERGGHQPVAEAPARTGRPVATRP